jgi:PadR family transcriptional regulator PadR
MPGLAEFELRVLLGALHRGEAAYAVAIRDEIRARTAQEVSLGSIYITLQRLERKGLLRSRLGDPTPERGGRAKRFYALTRSGVALVKAECRLTQRMWAGLGLVPEP